MALRNSSSKYLLRIENKLQKGKALTQDHAISKWPTRVQNPFLLVLGFPHYSVLTFSNDPSMFDGPSLSSVKTQGQQRWDPSEEKVGGYLAQVTHLWLGFWWMFPMRSRIQQRWYAHVTQRKGAFQEGKERVRTVKSLRHKTKGGSILTVSAS